MVSLFINKVSYNIAYTMLNNNKNILALYNDTVKANMNSDTLFIILNFIVYPP